jgi:hypothetical protein
MLIAFVGQPQHDTLQPSQTATQSVSAVHVCSNDEASTGVVHAPDEPLEEDPLDDDELPDDEEDPAHATRTSAPANTIE